MRKLLSCGLVAASCLVALPAAAQAVALGATESFDSLSSTDSSSVLPAGWSIAETDSNADGSYAVNDGSSNSGNTYSYGANGSTERSLGLLFSGSLAPVVGARIVNSSGTTLSSLDVSYRGEQWRLGAAGRDDRLDFQYSTDATSLEDGTWIDVDALDLLTPNTGAVLGANDGNAAANQRLVNGAITGLALANGAALWVRWVDVNVSGIDDGLAIDDVLFGTATDLAPTLAGSTPSEGGELPTDAAISLTFSEAVSLGADWFALDCSTSGLLGVADATITGGPSTWTIDLADDLADGETCTLTLAPAAITDLDGDADPLEGDTQIAFTAVAPPPNVAPSVVSTTPAQGSDSFPPAADIVVTFSEAVDVAGGAFALSCAQSTGIALSHPASGTSIGIDTGTALVHGDTCTFAIDEALVTDAEGAALQAFADLQFTVASDTAGAYYDQVNTSSPEQLRCSLHATIDDHTAYPYTASTTDTWDILNLADEDPTDSSKIWDVYRNESYTKITGGQGVYNREHTWPNTYGFSGGDPGAFTDTHMLYLTNTTYNTDRGSKPFANCDVNCGERVTVANHGVGGGGGGDSNWVQSGASEAMGSFEVWDFRKGDMARAVMYMAIRYEGEGLEPDLELTDNRSLITSAGSGGRHYMGLLSDLLAWHQADPPDARELARNEIVYSFQGNRNPFIDHPEWGTLALFASAQPASCTLALPAAIFADGFE